MSRKGIYKIRILKRRKGIVSATLKYNPISYRYISTTFYGYLDFDSENIWYQACEASWDPDFSYSFGYDDWHPGTISVQYNNYSGNRYPWHKKSPDTGSFKDGAITIAWSWMW